MVTSIGRMDKKEEEKEGTLMTIMIAVIAGGCYSAAFIAPKPYCYFAAVLAAIGAVVIRIF